MVDALSTGEEVQEKEQDEEGTRRVLTETGWAWLNRPEELGAKAYM
jgi:hypothetical protein